MFNSIINGRSSLDLGADLGHRVNSNGHTNGGYPINGNGNGHINGGYPINGNGSSNSLANGGSLSSTGGLWSFDGEGGSPLTSRRTSFDPGSRRTSMGDVGVGRSRLSLDGIGGGYGGMWSEDRSGVLNRGSPRQSLSLDILPEHVSNNNGIPAKLTSGLSVNGGTIGSSFGAGMSQSCRDPDGAARKRQLQPFLAWQPKFLIHQHRLLSGSGRCLRR